MAGEPVSADLSLPTPGHRRWLTPDHWRALLPGLTLAFIIALAATYVSDTQGGPVMLLALLMGMTVHSVADNETCRPGTALAASTLLKLGVALLGLRITAGQIGDLGLSVALLVVVGVLLAIGLGVALARLNKLPLGFGVISGGATAICGASAALAISSVMPHYPERETDTVFTVAGVTTLSTLAMIFYPGIAVLFGFNDHQAGILFGATIHDVAQVVGAGYAVSENAGDTATIIKLFRVVLLMPLVLVIGLAVGGSAAGSRKVVLPAFAVVFAVLIVINSLMVLPDRIVGPLDALSRWCLVAAVAALGMRTSLADLARVGLRPLVTIVVVTLALLAFVLTGLTVGVY